MTTRGLDRFAFAAVISSLVLLAADRLRHSRGFFFVLPSPRHFRGVWHQMWFVLRTRPALILGVALLVLGLCAALVAACADIGRVLGRSRSSRAD